MNEEKKIDQTGQETKTTELSEQDLDNVAGGTALSTSKSGIKTINAASPVDTNRAVKQGGIGA